MFTDGGADPNPGVGGWGLVLLAPDGGLEERCGGEPATTNNRMELMAAITALEAVPAGAELEISTDSRYVQRGVTEWLAGWKRRGFARAEGPLANADLWRRLDAALGRCRVSWRWVKGHAGDAMNERADELARRGRAELIAARPDLAPASVDGNATALGTGGEPVARARLKVSGSGGGRWSVELELPGAEPRRLEGPGDGGSTNRCELLAALAALAAVPAEMPLVLHSGSDYLRNGASEWVKGWKARGWVTKDGKPVANADLWRRIDRALVGRVTSWPKG